jgi:predicted dehydrogenase
MDLPIKKLRVGVVGVGHIGSNHARLYSQIDCVDFAAVYDVDLARANWIAKKYGGKISRRVRRID